MPISLVSVGNGLGAQPISTSATSKRISVATELGTWPLPDSKLNRGDSGLSNVLGDCGLATGLSRAWHPAPSFSKSSRRGGQAGHQQSQMVVASAWHIPKHNFLLRSKQQPKWMSLKVHLVQHPLLHRGQSDAAWNSTSRAWWEIFLHC